MPANRHINLSIEHLNNIDLSVETLNNIDLSVETLNNITLSVIEYYFTELLYNITANASLNLGAQVTISTLSQITAMCETVLEVNAQLGASSKIEANAGVSLGAIADLEISVSSNIIALTEVVLGTETAFNVLSRILANAGVTLGTSANLIAPAKIEANTEIVPEVNAELTAPANITPQTEISLGISGQLKAFANIIATAGIGLGVTSDLEAAGSSWTPASLSDLALWLDAADSDTITKDGSNYVSQWDDKSGNDNHVTQVEGSRQPIYSSNQVVFAKEDVLLSDIFLTDGLGDIDIYAVFEITNYEIGGQLFDIRVPSNETPLMDSDYSGKRVRYRSDSNVLRSTDSQTISNNTLVLMQYRYESNTKFYNRLNGSNLITGSDFTASISGDFRIAIAGNGNSPSFTSFTGNINEFILCRALQGDTARGNLETYLNNKWSIW
jgi:hypothetical protein